MKLSWLMVVVFALAAGACGSDSNSGGDAAAGSSGGGTTGSAGTTGRGGTTGGGGAGRGGTTGSAGTTGNAGATGGGGTTGTQPLGAACVNTGMCSQADGPAVCCLQLSTCMVASECPASPTYVPCSSANPCSKGGWVCCNAGGMNFCTKQSGCPAP